MAKYQLTEKQKDILRAASKGLRDGTIKQRWTRVSHGDYIFDVAGFSESKELGITIEDLIVFADMGFLIEQSSKPGSASNVVVEQSIHDAVASDFEIPSVLAQTASIQTNIYGPVIGSNLTVAQHLHHISQNVAAIPGLSDVDKSEIDKLMAAISEALSPHQESNPTEVNEVTRSVELVMRDLAEEPRDLENLRGAIARLKRASAKLVFSTVALAAVDKLAEFVESLANLGG